MLKKNGGLGWVDGLHFLFRSLIRVVLGLLLSVVRDGLDLRLGACAVCLLLLI